MLFYVLLDFVIVLFPFLFVVGAGRARKVAGLNPGGGAPVSWAYEDVPLHQRAFSCALTGRGFATGTGV